MIRPDDPRITVLIDPLRDPSVQQDHVNALIEQVDLALLAGRAFPLDVYETEHTKTQDELTITRVASLYRNVGWDLRIHPMAGVLYVFQGKRSDRIIRTDDPRVQSLRDARPPRIESIFRPSPPPDPHADATEVVLIEIVRRALLTATWLPIDIYATSRYVFSSAILLRVARRYAEAGWDIRTEPQPGTLFQIVGPRT